LQPGPWLPGAINIYQTLAPGAGIFFMIKRIKDSRFSAITAEVSECRYQQAQGPAVHNSILSLP